MSYGCSAWAQQQNPRNTVMPNFEVIAQGYDGEDDATDDRVLWVSAPSRLHLDYVIEGEPYSLVDPLPGDLKTDPQDFDFFLPDGDRALRSKLREFAALAISGVIPKRNKQ
jgi:hypothetical protein